MSKLDIIESAQANIMSHLTSIEAVVSERRIEVTNKKISENIKKISGIEKSQHFLSGQHDVHKTELSSLSKENKNNSKRVMIP